MSKKNEKNGILLYSISLIQYNILSKYCDIFLNLNIWTGSFLLFWKNYESIIYKWKQEEKIKLIFKCFVTKL